MMFFRSAALGAAAALIAACAAPAAKQGAARTSWTAPALATALSVGKRPQEDIDRDEDRKPAELLTFFGLERGMTAVDLIALGGYLTEALAVAVGPQGKVYAHNPPAALKLREGVYDRALTERLAGNRLPNVVRVDSDLPVAAIPAGSVDVAITAMNYHDVYNRDPALARGFVQAVYAMLKPGGVFGVTDHVGVEGQDNARLHRVPKQRLLEDAAAAGFIVEAESPVLAHAADDHTRPVFDPQLRGRTDQFVVRLRKPG